MKRTENNKGITLVALVVTIIILLILAGVTIYFAVNGGLLGKVEEAVNKSNEAGQNEANVLDQATAEIDKYLNGTGGSTTPEETFVNVEYEFDTSTGTITAIKDKTSYYQGTWNYGSPASVPCILPGGTVLDIPSQINGVEVKAIMGDKTAGGGSGVFNGCTSITKVIIPSTVTKIGDAGNMTREFCYCTSLKEVVIESNSITIESNTFNYCNNLEKITFTNITAENAPSGSPWSAPATCQIEYKK